MFYKKFSILTDAFTRLSGKTFLKGLRQQGYESISLYGAVPHFLLEDAGANQRKEFMAAARQEGLGIISLYPECTAYGYNPAAKDAVVRERTIEYYKRAAAIAGGLSIPDVVVHPGYMFRDEERVGALSRGIDSLRKITGVIQNEGLRPLILYGTGNYAPGLRGMKDILSGIGNDSVFVELDTGSLAAAGDTPEDVFAELKNRIASMRIYDGPGPHKIPGEGSYPLNEYIRLLTDKEPEAKLILEFDNRAYVTDPLKALSGFKSYKVFL